MPKFCTKCGSPLSEGIQFCTNCGAPIGPAPAATAAEPPAVTPAAAPKAGSPVVKIVLIVVGVLVVLTALGIGSCVYVAYRIKQRGAIIMQGTRSGSMSYGTPEVQAEKGGEESEVTGESEAAAVSFKDVPPYPGSKRTGAGGNLGVAGFGIAGQEYVTPDSVDQVVAFYKDKLGKKLVVRETEGNATISFAAADGSMTTIIVSRDEEAGETKIKITRIGK